MATRDLLGEAAEAFARTRSEAELRRSIDLWAPRFHLVLGKEIREEERPELNMAISRVPGRGGWAVNRGDSFFVGIGTEGGNERRFTLAHELAHVILDMARSRGAVESDDEEALCQFFAARALIPPALARAYLNHAGLPEDLEDIRRFAARFRVSLRASLVALDELLPRDRALAFVAASWREHPRGDEVFGLRVDVVACRAGILFPRHCRLSTLGYQNLEALVLEARPGSTVSGSDDAALKSRQSGVTKWRGKSGWTAERHLAPGFSATESIPGALCRIDLHELTPTKSRKRMGAPRGPVAVIPGQLGL